jgi:hypothetical protein
MNGGLLIAVGALVGLAFLLPSSGKKKAKVEKSPGWPKVPTTPKQPTKPPQVITIPDIVLKPEQPTVDPNNPNIIIMPPIVFGWEQGMPTPANEPPPKPPSGLPSPANEPPATGLPTPAAPPKPPAKPVLKSVELAKLIPPYRPEFASLDERAAISNPARAQIVSLLQTQWNEPLFLGTITPSDIGEALGMQGYVQANKAPLVAQIWTIFNAVVGDAMRDQYITSDVRAGKQPLTIGKQYMVSSPGNLTGVSERRYRALAGL